METLNDNQQKLAEAFDGLSSNIAAFKLDVDAQLEAMERVAGQVERTRRQHAARDSKKKEPDKPPEDEFGLPINNPDLRRARLEALVRK